jgi:hypothetical protein
MLMPIELGDAITARVFRACAFPPSARCTSEWRPTLKVKSVLLSGKFPLTKASRPQAFHDSLSAT